MIFGSDCHHSTRQVVEKLHSSNAGSSCCASDLIMTSEEVPIHQIVCIDEAGGIGKNGDLPWKIQKDWQHFLQHSLRILDTSKPKVCWILGKKSFELHSQEKGLFEDLEQEKGHSIIKIVMSKSWNELPAKYKNTADAYLANSWLEVENTVKSLKDKISEAWNIGGPKVYEAQLLQNTVKRRLGRKLYLTKLHQAFQCDTFYPTQYLEKLQYDIQEVTNVTEEEKGIKLSFHVYQL